MKNTNSQTVSQESQPAPRLHHVVLNTGHVTRHELNGMDRVSVGGFLPLLEKHISEVPEMPGFAFSVSEATHCAQFYLSYHGSEIITGGVAWGAGASDSLWRWLGDYYDYLAPWVPGWGASCPRTPPALPWLGVVLNLNIGLIAQAQAKQLKVVERNLALALIQRALARN